MASTRKSSVDHGRKSLGTISTQKNNNQAYVHETIDARQFVKEHPFLSTLLNQDGILFECDGEAPSPSKDYGQLQITMDKV